MSVKMQVQQNADDQQIKKLRVEDEVNVYNDRPNNNYLINVVDSGDDLETAELLILRQKVNIYCKDGKGLTPLDVLIKKKIKLLDELRVKKLEEFTNFSLTAKIKKALREEDSKEESYAEQYRQIYRLQDEQRKRSFETRKAASLNALQKIIEKTDELIDMLLINSFDYNCTKDMKLLNLHAACTLEDSSIANGLSQVDGILRSVRINPPIYPGYTALHFAAHCNLNIVQKLVVKGANLLKEDANGVTPLDICLKSFCIEEIQSIFRISSAWENILFSDGKTKLVDYISSMHNSVDHNKFLEGMGENVGALLPKDSPLWPSCTVLHIAVIMLSESHHQIIKDILTIQPQIIIVQDGRGSTPVHLAFRKNKFKFLDILFKYHKSKLNPADKNNLTHLHIAASVNSRIMIKKLLKSGANCNAIYKGDPLPTVKLGWTALHVATFTNHTVVARILLQGGANIYQTDAEGFTAIHLLLLPKCNKKIADELLAIKQLKDSVVYNIGLSHLHVAVWHNNCTAIERLLKSGANIEAIIFHINEEELKEFEGYKPIHMAMMNCRYKVFTLLLKKGADIFVKKSNGTSVLYYVLVEKYDRDLLTPVLRLLGNNEHLQIRMRNEMGMTLLHVACYALDISKAKELIEKGYDVNARMKNNSSIWPGFTPLHVVVSAGLRLERDKKMQWAVDDLCHLLLKHGADVTVPNRSGSTPVLLAVEARFNENSHSRSNTLMDYQHDLSINPMNNIGMSHFHVACILNKQDLILEFLEKSSDIDINQAVRTNSGSKFAGNTPLHLALSPRRKKVNTVENQLEIVKILIKHGADTKVIDAFGYTILHKIVSCTQTHHFLWSKFIPYNREMNKHANDGKTPMEIMLWAGAPINELVFLMNHGGKLNSYNPISGVGYMAIVFTNRKYGPLPCDGNNEILNMMINLPDIVEISTAGRNAIHNLVSIETERIDVIEAYCALIERLENLGCDIDKQDNRGKTALHLAVKFQNRAAVTALLHCGADVNTVDFNDKSPFIYATEFYRNMKPYETHEGSNRAICNAFANHLRKLQYIGLQVSNSNAKALNKMLSDREDIAVIPVGNVINKQLTAATETVLCTVRGFTLREFLYQTGAVNLYPLLSSEDRDNVDYFFNGLDYRFYSELKGILKLQYKNARERSSVAWPAVDGIRKLLRYPLPDACVGIILQYLTNLDLKNLKSAMSRKS